MHITSDNFSVYAAVAFSALSAVLWGIVGALRLAASSGDRASVGAESLPTHSSAVWLRWARFCCFGAAASFSYALLYLLGQILSGMRYDLAYVYEHTGPADQTIYRFSALWAGQEGSMLVWLAMCAWVAVLIVTRTRDRLPLAVSFWSVMISALGVVLLISDPFAHLGDWRPGVVGAGLNPLLRNPWIAIHPPVVFIGYVALMVPAAFVADALLRRKYERWVSLALPWAVFGWTCLGAGIAMGMVWSYEVLGWGGYWGWDPVENASLIPWLLSGALIHGLLVQRRTCRLVLANRVLALGVFLSIVYAAYLTRSGALSELSVHSFGDGGAYVYWNGLLAAWAAICVGLVAMRWRDGRSEPKKTFLADKLVVLGIVGIVLFTIAVLVGTSLPLLTKTMIRPRFYNHMAAPIAVLIVVLTAAMVVIRRRLTWASHLAHAGIALMMVGVVFSSSAGSRSISLMKNGPAGTAFGYAFSYQGRYSGGPGREVAGFTVKRGGQTFTAPIVMEYTEQQAVRFPFVRAGLVSDLYVSPVEMGSIMVTPTASVTDQGWVSPPARIPGTRATVTLLGMQVEQDMAKLRYRPARGHWIDVEAVKGKAVSAGGCVFEVRRLLVTHTKDMSSITAGADVAVSGNDLPDVAVIQVSVKPLVSFVWLGLCLITLGGVMAAVRRIREGARSKDWATTR